MVLCEPWCPSGLCGKSTGGSHCTPLYESSLLLWRSLGFVGGVLLFVLIGAFHRYGIIIILAFRDPEFLQRMRRRQPRGLEVVRLLILLHRLLGVFVINPGYFTLIVPGLMQ